MIIRSLRKRLSKAEVYVEFNDPNKVIIRDIVDYYKYLDELDINPGLDKKELIYKPRPRKSPKETFCDLLIKYDRHYSGYVGDEIADSLSSCSADEKDELNTESCAESSEKQLIKEVKKQIHVQQINKTEPQAEKMRRRKALECCGSFG